VQNSTVVFQMNISNKTNICASIFRPNAKPQTVSGKASIFMNLPVAPFYVMPPDKAAAIKILLYPLTAGWCKVGYSTPMNV
jgi:hypothetical protein